MRTHWVHNNHVLVRKKKKEKKNAHTRQRTVEQVYVGQTKMNENPYKQFQRRVKNEIKLAHELNKFACVRIKREKTQRT